MDYQALRFTDLYHEDNEHWVAYQELWKFLQTEPIWGLLKLSTDYNHPAVEGIGDKLLERFDYLLFPENPKFKRIKQMIGDMVKIIMESHGYTTTSTIKCTKKLELFTYGMRYKPSI
jgi:hypothetical protein